MFSSIQLYEKAFLEMADLAIISGADPNKISKIAESLGYFTCVWCKERGNYPSKYLKKSDSFKKSFSDTWLNGKVCDDCINNGNNFTY